MSIAQRKPMHPGIFIKRVYLAPHAISSNALARQLKVSTALVSRLLNGRAGLSCETALKLFRVLGRSPESWLLMQNSYDLWQAKQAINLWEYQQLRLVSDSPK